MEKQPCQAWMQEPRLQFHARLRPSSKILDIGPSGFSAEGIDWTTFPTGGKKQLRRAEPAPDFPSSGEYAGRVKALGNDPGQRAFHWVYADLAPTHGEPPDYLTLSRGGLLRTIHDLVERPTNLAVSLPYPTATFDGVWVNTMNLRLSVDWGAKGLAEIRRILNDGGVLYCYAPGAETGCVWGGPVENFAYRLAGNDLAWLLERAGFSIRSGRVQEHTMRGAVGGIRHGYSILAVAV